MTAPPLPPPPQVQQFQHPAPGPGRGTIAWAMGLAVLMCLPFVGSVLASVLMITVGLSLRSKGGLAARNGVHAANWGLTYLVLTVVLVGTHFGLLWYLTADDPDGIEGFFPFGLVITAWALVSLWHLVLCMWGIVASGQGRELRGTGLPVWRASA